MQGRDPKLGAWGKDGDELARAPLTGRGNDDDAPDALRFSRAVMQLVSDRERQTDAEFDRPAAFILSTAAGQEAAAAAGAKRNRLLNSGHYPLTGQLHFVNVVCAGHSLSYTGGPDDLFDAIAAMGAQSAPALIYSPKPGASVLMWYPNGIGDECHCERLLVAEVIPTVERITEAVSQVYTQELMTPDQTPKEAQLWTHAEKGWAHENAEARVQRAVRLTLLGAFRHCSIRAEQPGWDGRTDLEIVEECHRPSNQVVHHAVLEMKVLRERGSTGQLYANDKIDQHMREGLEQAHSYGDGRNFKERMLCCFDMRAENVGEDAVMAPLKADADTLGVHLRHWFLYRSSEHWRTCSVAQALKAAKTQ